MKKKNCQLISHPLLDHWLCVLRDKRTRPTEFRIALTRLTTHLVYEIARDLEVEAFDVMTPFEKAAACRVKQPVTLVPILRAGEGMLEAALNVLPFSRVGHIGIYRDKKIH